VGASFHSIDFASGVNEIGKVKFIVIVPYCISWQIDDDRNRYFMNIAIKKNSLSLIV